MAHLQRKRYRLGGLAVTAALLMAGSASASRDAVGSPLTRSAWVSMSVNFSPQSLDPAGGSWQLVQLGIGETLTRLDRAGNVRPWLATSWTHTPDFMTWTFTLRKRVRFTDGKPMTAAAVAGALQRNTTLNPSAQRLLNPAPNGILASSPNRVTVKLNAPNPVLYATVSQYNFVIYDPNSLSQISSRPSLTGAYIPGAFAAGYGMNLLPNPHYWGKRPKVPGIHVFFQSDGNTRVNSLLSGQSDLAYQVPFQSVPTIRATHGFLVKSVLSGYEDFLILNTKLPQFSDPVVRRALSEAIDRQALAKLDGNHAAVGPVSPVYPFALKGGGPRFDAARASAELDADGWRVASDGVRAKGDTRLAFTMVYYAARPELADMAVVIQSELKQIGVAVTLQEVPCCSAYRSSAFMAGLYANNTAPTGDPDSFFAPFYGAGNMANFSSPQLDADLRALDTTSQPRSRLALILKTQRDALDASPYIFLTVPVFNIALDRRLRDYRPWSTDYYVIDNSVAVAR